MFGCISILVLSKTNNSNNKKKQCKQTHGKNCKDSKVGLLDLLLLDDRVGGVCIMAIYTVTENMSSSHRETS